MYHTNGVSRFNGCLLVFIILSIASFAIPVFLVIGYVFNSYYIILAIPPLLYLVLINIAGYRSIGTEQVQAYRETTEGLTSLSYFRKSGGAIFLVAFLGGAAGVLLGRRRFNYGLESKMFKFGLILLLFQNIYGYAQVFTFSLGLGAIFENYLREESRKEEVGKDWFASKETADGVVKTVNTFGKELEKAHIQRDISVFTTINRTGYFASQIENKINYQETKIKIKLKETQVFYDERIESYDTNPKKITIPVKLKYQEIYDPRDGFDSDAYQYIEFYMYYDEEAKKWTIEHLNYYPITMEDEITTEPIVTKMK
ncbi:hypothetical protein [Hazenella coriacea]|uniref:YvbJ-like NTF2-like domain-containing protein n=1 Tax=Hazenella coriacea TaxID=1179467 RepID=A0A4V2UVG7_9BACL|nr:hypothetical protein [Hazenella coriacea]TCS95717.1 hypothetical protein EDD58_102293 [Hazenella coriacea]